MTGWTKAWVAWGTTSAITFGVIEHRALKVQGASLSEHLRTGFGFDDLGPAPEIRQLAFIAVWGWFGLHIFRKTAGCVSNLTPPIPPS